MVMVEALASGTPVIAFPSGAAPELVDDGATGFLVDDVDEMADAVGRLQEIDPLTCRRQVAECCDAPVVARAFEDAYRTVAAEAAARPGGMLDAPPELSGAAS
jgi:glycosyltransferase involved in cell wall biosynthesis